VIGGNAAGLELAQLFARLGTRVTVAGRLDRLAPYGEPEVPAAIEDVFDGEGTGILTAASVVSVRRDGPARSAVIKTAGTPGRELAYGQVLAGAGRAVDYAALPRVTFTSPAIAAAGLTEAGLAGQAVACGCRVLPLPAVPRAAVDRDTRGVVKLVAGAGTGRVRGAHAAGGAGEMITAACYAIQAGMTVAGLAAAWAPYLTVSEGLRLAAQAFSRDVSRLSCCAA
jgi:pyruvate/2-oxoglutarate dehydrogenase complex dihydrolipoamide dehydrogenase (E3) component